ncbi:hypothetical protein BJ165DRAFT_1353298 [Panaeolus papilionaceus]|nr:hypothetical protein BJ165DRAFT_1353298 [Panaeolus papilionaceus]
MSISWHNLLVRLVNILVYFILLGSTVHAVASSSYADYYGEETYVTPAPWAFLIWFVTVIHSLLFGTLIYQFFPRGKEIIVDGIAWRFSCLAILNAIYSTFWATHHTYWALLFACFVTAEVTHIYTVIKKDHPSQTFFEELFVHLPFSLYHGWTTVLLVISAFDAFGVKRLDHSPGVWTKIFVLCAFMFLNATAAAYASPVKGGPDIPAAVAICWSLWAIYVQQTRTASEFVHWTALVYAIISLSWIINGAVVLVKEGGRGVVVD